MIFFSIPNLAASEVTSFEVTEPPAIERPPFQTKDDYRKWCQNDRTEHAFISTVEGVSPHQRVSAGNLPYRLHGLCGEYDATVPAEWETQHLAKLQHPPEWSTRTFSGNGRAWWSFAEPVDISVPAFAAEFIRVAQAELKMRRAGPGFEPEESGRLTQYFEAGFPWVKVGQPISATTLEAWKYRAAQKIDWSKESVAVPIERVRAEAERKFPGRWPGGYKSFEVGARGVRFWDNSADATSVLVTEAGCVCFTGDKSWVPWSEIFGLEWVRRQSDDVIGSALLNFWSENAKGRYWRRESDGRKVLIPTRHDLSLHLNIAGLSPKTPKGETVSEIERAIYTLQRTRVIEGIHPAFYRTEDVVQVMGKPFLNISTIRPGVPAEGTYRWGQGFPWIAGYFEQVFGEMDQHIRLLSWAAHFYQGALRGEALRGLACVIAGVGSIGKTFIGAALFKALFGAREDAGAFLTGEDQFNQTLFASPFWCVDDQVLTSDRKHHLRYSQLLKYVVANDSIRIRGMNREGYTAPWCGRILVTCNLDGESMGMVPNLEIESLNKTLILRGRASNITFPSDEEIAPELPYWFAWMRDYHIPDEMREHRFGVRAWHHPDLLVAAAEASDTMGAEQILTIWRQRYFEDHPDKKEWVGSATELLSALEDYESLRGIASRQIPTPNRMGHYVSKLEGRRDAWVRRGPPGRGGYRPICITRPEAGE